MSVAVLRCKVLQIAGELGTAISSASTGYFQDWARRHDIESVALHGQEASANIEEAAERMDEIRRQLHGVEAELIYNAEETGLLFRGLPSR